MSRSVSGVVLIVVGLLGLAFVYSMRPPSGFGEALMMLAQGRNAFIQEPLYQVLMAACALVSGAGVLLTVSARRPDGRVHTSPGAATIRICGLLLLLGASAPLAAADDAAPASLGTATTMRLTGEALVRRAETTPSSAAPAPSAWSAEVPEANRAAAAAQRSAPMASESVHRVGLGAKAGGLTFGVGASGRAWQSERLGVQVDVSHFSVGSVGLLQIAPSVIVALGESGADPESRIRPYAGGGINLLRASFGALSTDTGVGVAGFVGAETMFSGAPRFRLSGDIGYYSTGTFFGVNVGGFALSVLGHYYIR